MIARVDGEEVLLPTLFSLEIAGLLAPKPFQINNMQNAIRSNELPFGDTLPCLHSPASINFVT